MDELSSLRQQNYELQEKVYDWHKCEDGFPTHAWYQDYLVQYQTGDYGVAIWQGSFWNTFGQGKVFRYKKFDK